MGRLMIFACIAVLAVAISCGGSPEPVDDPTILYPIMTAEKMGYIDGEGNVVIEPQYDPLSDFTEKTDMTFGSEISIGRLGEFSEGLAAVRLKEGRWAYIDKAGNIIFKVNALEVYPFSDGFTLLFNNEEEKDPEYWFLNRNGKNQFGTVFSGAYPFSEGLAPVSHKDTHHYIDTDGKKVIINLRGGPFVEDIAAAGSPAGLHWGYIDKTGAFVIQPAYPYADQFSEGMAMVTLDIATRELAYIDTSGEIVIESQPYFIEIGRFNDGMAVITEGSGRSRRWGFIDKTGEIAIPMKYKGAFEFSEGLARVKIGDKWGYIDKSNKVVIEPQFNMAWPFKNGLAWVETDEGNGYINKKDEFIWGPVF